jgi:hypothetical protein
MGEITLKKTFTFESFIEDFYEKVIKDKTGLDVNCSISLYDLFSSSPITIWVDDNLDEETKEKLWEIGFHEKEIE